MKTTCDANKIFNTAEFKDNPDIYVVGKKRCQVFHFKSKIRIRKLYFFSFL